MNARIDNLTAQAAMADLHASASAEPDLAQLARNGLMPLADLLAYTEQLQRQGYAQQACNLYALWLGSATDARRHVVYFNYGSLLQAQGQTAQARLAYEGCLALEPLFSQARINLGLSQERQGDSDLALQTWAQVVGQALLANGPSVEMQTLALNHIGRVQEQQRQYLLAEEALEKSLRLNPHQPGVIQHWVHIRQKACRWPVYKPLPGISLGQMVSATSPLAMLALSDDPRQQLLTAQAFVARTYAFQEERLYKGQPYQHGRLRIGYVSADLREHAVGFLLPAFLAAHDAGRYELYAYDFTKEGTGPLREEIKALFEHVRPIHGLTDRQAAQRVLDDEIDILIDLHGLSAGARPGIFALHPAPRQGTYLGFIGSTGMPWFDFVLADRHVLPSELAVHFTEKPLYLEGTFLPQAAQRQQLPAVTRQEVGLADDAFVMGAFGNVYKITPRMFQSWMNLLHRIPQAVLWLIDDNPATTANLRAEAAKAGIDVARLVFTQRTDHLNFCARLRLADVYVDTYPYNCGSTSRDVINAGVPLVTLYGPTMVSRMGLSILHSVNAAHYAVDSWSGYEDKVLEVFLKKGAGPANVYAGLPEHQRSARIHTALDQLDQADPAWPGIDLLGQASQAPPRAQALGLSLHHIAYSPETRQALPPQFTLLDNTRNERADWREYWPMRQFLRTNTLQDHTFYGFFSPRFSYKTGLGHDEISAFARRHGAGHDVLAFSPFWDLNSLFLNPFLQGDLFHPGLLAAAQQFCDAIGLEVDLSRQVMHSDNTIFCNYFVAKKGFWLRWLEMGEKLFAGAEDPDSPLYATLNAPTRYSSQDVSIKVFLQERLVSLVLLQDGFRAKAYDMFALNPSVTPLNQFREEAVSANALKHHHVSSGHGPSLAQFEYLQARIFEAGLPAVTA